MTARRRSNAQAVPSGRRMAPYLHLVPRSVAAAAEQSVVGLRSRRWLRNVDFHPAMYILIGVAILTFVAFVYLGQVNAVGNANYTLQELKREHSDLLQQKQDLQLQIARAQSLTNIERVAHDRLHMVPIDDNYKYLMLAPGPLQESEIGNNGSPVTPIPNP
jgi:hypothetical protein